MTDEAPEATDTGPKTKVFISYSRVDVEFAKRILDALEERGFEVLIDLSGIAPSEKWWTRIKELITKTDTVVFILSPDSVASSVCKEEVEFAATLNKRFVPILCRRVDAGKVPAELRELNWIFLDDPAVFGERVGRLLEALETDIEWIRKHTQFSEFAQVWNAAGRPGKEGLLLRPPRLSEAETLLMARQPLGMPDPELLRTFVTVSRQAYDEEQAAVAASQLNLIVELAEAQRLRGSVDSALRLCVHAARGGLRPRPRAVVPPRVAAALAAAVAQSELRLMLSGHNDKVNSAAFSPDGMRVLTASEDKTARIWDAATGNEIAVLHGEADVRSAAFSPDGDRIVTTSGAAASIWKVATAEQLATLRGHTAFVCSAKFSPDARRVVTASSDKTVRIWDVATGRQTAALGGEDEDFLSANFSPDGSRIVTTSVLSDRAQIWDAASATKVAALQHNGRVVNSAAFGPDGKLIITASENIFIDEKEDPSAHIWDASSGNEIFVLSGHIKPIRSAAFSPDGKQIVTASDDGTARVWDAATAKEICVLWGHLAQLNSASFSPDGTRIVTASSDKTARIWNAATKEVATLTGHKRDFAGRDLANRVEIFSGAFSPDGARIVTAQNRRHKSEIVSNSEDNSVRVWDVATTKQVAAMRADDGTVGSVSFNQDGTRIVVASGENACIYELATGEQVARLRGHRHSVTSVVYAPNEARIVTASRDNTARIWDATTGNEMVVLNGHEADVVSASYSPDGLRVVTASDDSTARVWDAASGKHIAVLKGHKAGVSSAIFSPDGKRILTTPQTRSDLARLWSAANAQEIAVLRAPDSGVASANFSPDGSRIVTAPWMLMPRGGDDDTARIWDAATGIEIAVLRGHDAPVNSVSFSRDGTRIVTTSRDETARIWDAATAKEILALRGHKWSVWSASFSPDGKYIVTLSGIARIWNVNFATMSTQDLVVEVCMRRLRGRTMMSRDEMRLAGYPDEMPEIDVGKGI